MTVSSQIFFNEFTGDGIEDTFAYTFRILDESHIDVTVDDVAQTLNVDYTVENVTSSGGDIVFGTPPADTLTVRVERNTPRTQETAYNEYDPFPAASHEEGLDKLTMSQQEFAQRLTIAEATHFDPESNQTIEGDWDFIGAFTVDVIDEYTSDAGVTIDGVLIKDGGIPEAVVTAHQLALSIIASQIDAESSTDGHVLTSDGAGNAAWEVPPGAAGGATQLSELSDVNSSTPTNRNALVADGADWESRALTEADISDLGTYEPADATLVRDDDAGYNNTDWDTAFGWGDHAGTYEVINPKITRHVTATYNSGDIYVSASAPGSPSKGDIWFDIS